MSKIVHIMLAGPVTDGWTYQDNMITKYHKKLGHEVTMITSKWTWGINGKLEKTDRSEYINEDGVFVVRLELSGKDNFQKKYKRYIGLASRLEQESPDMLFIHNVSFGDMGAVVQYIKKHPNIKVYVDNHSDFSNSGTNWLSKNVLHKIIWKRNAQMIEPYTNKFYGVLPARVDWLKEIYGLPASKCELLVMGGDDDEIECAEMDGARTKIRNQYGIENDDFLIITGGKIDSAKRQTLLLMEAVHKIQDPKIKLIVFGSVEETLMPEVCRLSDGERVKYIGWVKGSDSYRYFFASDLVVFPGRHSVFWEQVVAQGIPMICKYWDGTTHVNVNGNVNFIKTDTVDEIKEKIEQYLDVNVYDLQKEKARKAANLFRYSSIAKRSIEY